MHSHAARLVCKQQQTAALERQPDRRASLRQNGTGGGRVFAGWIWRGLALLATGVGRAKTVMRRWGYLDDAQSVDCDCGEPHTMAHLLSCRLLDEACTPDDLATVTERAKACARKWEKIVRRTRKKKKIWWSLLPSNILSYFCMVHMSHDHDTRQAGHFKNMYCRTTLKSMCLSIRGPVMWNKLHSDLKNSTTVNMFKKRYKTFLVSEYEAT